MVVLALLFIITVSVVVGAKSNEKMFLMGYRIGLKEGKDIANDR